MSETIPIPVGPFKAAMRMIDDEAAGVTLLPVEDAFDCAFDCAFVTEVVILAAEQAELMVNIKTIRMVILDN
jgi:hypothetical protein